MFLSTTRCRLSGVTALNLKAGKATISMVSADSLAVGAKAMIAECK